MISLVLVFCLASGNCTEQRPVTDELQSPMACLLQGERLAQEWLVDHPDWHLARVRCEQPRQSPQR